MLPVIGCTINVGRESQVTSHHAYSIANVSYEAHIVGSIKCIVNICYEISRSRVTRVTMPSKNYMLSYLCRLGQSSLFSIVYPKVTAIWLSFVHHQYFTCMPVYLTNPSAKETLYSKSTTTSYCYFASRLTLPTSIYYLEIVQVAPASLSVSSPQ